MLKIRDIPLSFVSPSTQSERAQKWVDRRLDIDAMSTALGVASECIQKDVRIVNDPTVSFMLCLWKKSQKDVGSTMSTLQQRPNMAQKCDWNQLGQSLYDELIRQFMAIFGDSSKIHINLTNSHFLSVTTHRVPSTKRKQKNDLPDWIRTKLKRVHFESEMRCLR